MSYACPGLPYGKEDQIILINDEPIKAFLESKVEWSFSWIIKGTNVDKEQDAMVGPCITIVAIIARISFNQDSPNSLWPYGQIF